MIPKIAYIDESGNHDLGTSKPGVSPYFIVCAVIVDADKNERFANDADVIRANHFQSCEMRSSDERLFRCFVYAFYSTLTQQQSTSTSQLLAAFRP